MRKLIIAASILLISSICAFAESDRFSVRTEKGRKVGVPTEKWSTCYNIDGGNLSQRIVDAAVREWAAFSFPVWDIATGSSLFFPKRFSADGGITYQVVPDNLNRIIPKGGVVPRLLRQGAKEDDTVVEDRIGEYWSIIEPVETTRGTSYREGIAQQNTLWKSWKSAGWAVPWSAAFVSWVMCEAGLEMKNFQRSATHSNYTWDIIQNGHLSERMFTAHNIYEGIKLSPGDVICADRQSSSLPYVSSIDDKRISGRLTHCDIVVKVSHNRVFAVGGNVIDGATMTITKLDSNGNLIQAVRRHDKSKKHIRHWYSILKLKNNQNASDDGGKALQTALAQPYVNKIIEELAPKDQ